MKFQEYRLLTRRTLPDLGEKYPLYPELSKVLNTVHMSMGIVSETHELLLASTKKDSVNMSEELADKCWYAANYAFVNDIDLPDFEFPGVHVKVKYDGLDKFDELGEQLFFFEGELIDMDKKLLAYGKERDMVRAEKMLYGLLYCINNAAVGQKIDLEKAMENNINKLRVRFPNKFNNEDAINRDLESERKELEK